MRKPFSEALQKVVIVTVLAHSCVEDGGVRSCGCMRAPPELPLDLARNQH